MRKMSEKLGSLLAVVARLEDAGINSMSADASYAFSGGSYPGKGSEYPCVTIFIKNDEKDSAIETIGNYSQFMRTRNMSNGTPVDCYLTVNDVVIEVICYDR